MNTQVHPHYLGEKKLILSENKSWQTPMLGLLIRLVSSVTILITFTTYQRIFTSLCYICLSHLKCSIISSSLPNHILRNQRPNSNPTFFTVHLFPDYLDIFLFWPSMAFIKYLTICIDWCYLISAYTSWLTRLENGPGQEAYFNLSDFSQYL